MHRLTTCFLNSIMLLATAAPELLRCSPLSSPLERDGSQWERYTAQNEEFTALFPEQPSKYFLGTVINGHRYAAYSDDLVFLIISLDTSHHQFPLQVYVNNEIMNPFVEYTFKRNLSLNGLKGKQYFMKMRNGIVGVTNFYAAKKHVYQIQVLGADDTHPAVQKFFESITLGDKPEARDTGIGARSEPQKLEASGVDPVYDAQQVTRKAIIITTRVMQRTPQAIKNNSHGTVVLKAVLRSTGVVTDIEVVSGLPDGLTEASVEALRKTYFVPAVLNGKRVSQSLVFKDMYNKLR